MGLGRNVHSKISWFRERENIEGQRSQFHLFLTHSLLKAPLTVNKTFGMNKYLKGTVLIKIPLSKIVFTMLF